MWGDLEKERYRKKDIEREDGREGKGRGRKRRRETGGHRKGYGKIKGMENCFPKLYVQVVSGKSYSRL